MVLSLVKYAKYLLQHLPIKAWTSSSVLIWVSRNPIRISISSLAPLSALVADMTGCQLSLSGNKSPRTNSLWIRSSFRRLSKISTLPSRANKCNLVSPVSAISAWENISGLLARASLYSLNSDSQLPKKVHFDRQKVDVSQFWSTKSRSYSIWSICICTEK